MADDADRATDIAEREREYCIRLAQRKANIAGPYVCVWCREINDRRERGYSVCTDCLEEERDGGSGGKL